MNLAALIAVVGLLTLIVVVVGEPLRQGRAEAADERERRDIEALEEAKLAKYREIRELEMDFRTGKLDEAEYRRQDRERRAEAVELLRRLDRLGADETTRAAAEAVLAESPIDAAAPVGALDR